MATPWKHPQSGIYYHRVAVPEDLRPAIGKSVIKSSLKTRDFAEAKRLFAPAYASTLQLFEQHRAKTKVTSRDIRTLVDRWLKEAIEELESNDNFADYLRVHENGQADDDTEDLIDALRAGHYQREVFTGGIARRLIQENGLPIAKGTDQYQELVRLLCEQKIQLNLVCLKRYYGDWEPVAEAHVRLASRPLGKEGSAPAQLPKGAFKSLGAVVEEYIKHKMSRGDWVYKSEQDARGIFGLFVDTFGAATDPNTITREQFREFAQLLGRIPQRYNVHKAFKGLGMREIIELGAELEMPVLSAATVKKKFVFIKSLFKFAGQEEWVDRNRAEGITVKVDPESQDARLPYTPAELNKILRATKKVERPSDYWVPRIALTTGMRANEILQLHVSDVKVYEGVWYLDINKLTDAGTGKAKKVKTKNSIRKVPVPEVLIEAGFLSYVTAMESDRLFPCVRVGSDGTYSKTYGNRFNPLVSELGIKPPKGSGKLKDFHSLRHTFRAHAREYGVGKEYIDLICGWKGDDSATTGDDYGREFTAFLGQLKKNIDGIDYSEAGLGLKSF